MLEYRKTPGFGVHTRLRFQDVKFEYEEVASLVILRRTYLFVLVPTVLFALSAAFLRTDPGFIGAAITGLFSILALLAAREILGKDGLRIVRLKLKDGSIKHAVLHRTEAELMVATVESALAMFAAGRRLAQRSTP